MIDGQVGLAQILEGDLSVRWTRSEQRLSEFFQSIGLTKDLHSKSLYIFPQMPSDLGGYLEKLRTELDHDEHWAFLTGKGEKSKATVVLVFPVNNTLRIEGARGFSKAFQALFIEAHSRLITWWLVNAWRSWQLAEATWHLANSMQIVPAAACARSLVETAASVWMEAKELQKMWGEIKADYSKNGLSYELYHGLIVYIYKMQWGAKFDNKVPDLNKAYERLPRINVLTQLEKLARATDYPLQRDYQWLCNVVHPSVGGMLAFQAPLMRHETGVCAFQFVCGVPLHIDSISGQTLRETTVQDALARVAVLAVYVLEKTLNDALRIVDDIGLTTKAPKMASFSYWRNLTQGHRKTSCPCRSGKAGKTLFPPLDGTSADRCRAV
jgi:hypothetical protein